MLPLVLIQIFLSRETIPEEEQSKIFNEVYTKLHEMEVTKRRLKHKRTFVRPQKTG